MKEFAVEKTKASVTLRLAGGALRRGHLFLPVEPHDEPTVNKLRTLLSGPEHFLPFEATDGTIVVQNKAVILWCRYDGPVGPVVEVLRERRRMTLVLTDGTTVSGDVVADGPADQRRVLDCLNRSGSYLLVEASEADYLVRQESIDTVPSAELGEPREMDGTAFQVEEPELTTV